MSTPAGSKPGLAWRTARKLFGGESGAREGDEGNGDFHRDQGAAQALGARMEAGAAAGALQGLAQVGMDHPEGGCQSGQKTGQQ